MSNKTKTDRFFIGVCDIDLHIENCHSLKERRSVLLSLKEKIKNRLNVAVCEFGDSELWQRSRLAIVTCSNTKNIVESTIRDALDFINNFPSVIVLNSESRVI
uniref:DUF503 domain-containing protein n=1 Tax=candidate division WOR-3 bacterium TaxID=2052148 RepID=A0A7V3RGU5_UNCW3